MFQIADLPLREGRIGLCPLPGRGGDYAGDYASVRAWGPGLVMSLVSEIELEAGGADSLAADLRRDGIAWRHLPVTDYRAPCAGFDRTWPEVSAQAQAVLARGGRVLAHCYGGCGRSGMTLMRLMVDAGEAPDSALSRLRKVRPCAVETASQYAWAGAAAAAK